MVKVAGDFSPAGLSFACRFGCLKNPIARVGQQILHVCFRQF
jgi:hypothetical protein